jgi:hypothetical protein
VSPAQQYTYIDAYNQGEFMTQEECPDALGVPPSMVQGPQVYECIQSREVSSIV